MNLRPGLISVLTWLVTSQAWAGVVVTQNVSPGATAWPGSAFYSSLTNPAVQATVAESFNSANTNLAQTFAISGATYVLQTIDIYAGLGTGTGTGTNLILGLYDLGAQTAPNPSNYVSAIIGTNLFGAGAGLSVTCTNQTAGVLKFDFTGTDQVVLTNGHSYAFELSGGLGTQPIFWYRSTADTDTNGAAYRNRFWINGNSARDFALAIYATNAYPVTTNTATCRVDASTRLQTIDGFGGGVVFLDSGLDPVTSTNMDTLYGTNTATELGLSLLRVRIDPSTNWSTALSDAQKAVARGAGVLATPWTPPASMKDNGVLTNGSLLPAQYANYAAYLKNFAGYLASNSAPLRAISVQNEPDWPTTYESCVWSAAQFLSFFRTNAPAIGTTPVLMPESLGYNFTYSDATLNDSVAVTNVALIGGHLYGVTTIQDYTNAHNKGKPTWMTEFLLNDQTIASALVTAKQLHDCLTTANMSAYIWWKCLGDANGLVNAAGVPQKRGFVMAQFSRFIRPGFNRVGATNNATVAFISAYQNTNSLQFAVVAINTNSATYVNQTIQLTNITAASVTPWVTSETLSLASQSSIVVSNGTFAYLLPPQSVVTFVGQATTNTAPTLTAIASQTINAGVSLILTNTAADTNLPAQTLTFSLVTAPTNATLVQLNNSNAVFSWRPLVSQAGTTNQVTVTVADGGSPSLSVTNQFLVKVNPVSQPVLVSSVSISGKMSLTVTGLLGPDYTLLTSTNLADWHPLYTTNPASMPVTFTDTNGGNTRFYRLQLGP